LLAPAVLLLLGAAWCVAWTRTYSWLNDRGSRTPNALTFEPPRSWLPWTFAPGWAVVYLVGGLVLPLAPLAVDRRSRALLRLFAVYTLGSATLFAFYAGLPVRMARPDYSGSGLGDRVMRLVTSLDAPANCFPSSHVFFATASAMLFTGGSRSRRLTGVVWTAAAAVAISTIAVGQHYFVDVVGGAGVAVGSVFLVRWLLPDTSRGLLAIAGKD
jgi:membrane-associated phospholipid phosphatase